jgi:hypothetical protein
LRAVKISILKQANVGKAPVLSLKTTVCCRDEHAPAPATPHERETERREKRL